jgi:peptidoglycan/LPS O-acetylase OafA/YrhL
VRLDQILIRSNNNFELLRLIASISVIYYHGFFLFSKEGFVDFISQNLKYDDLGPLAVKFFFFISGLCVCNSLLEGNNVRTYLVSRFFRIMPAYFFVLVFCGFFIGPIVTSLKFDEYFTNFDTYDYVLSNLLFITKFSLPGVFDNNPFPSGINGSLWTIAYEVGAYLGLLSLFMIGIHRYKWISLLTFILIMMDLTQGFKFIFSWRVVDPSIDYLIASFAFGSILAVFKKEVDINFNVVIGILLLYFLLFKSRQAELIFYALIFLLLLLISIQPWFLKLRPTNDLSFGIYLWGFPIQQLIIYFFPEINLYFYLLISILLSIFVAFLSWFFVEKKAISYGKKYSVRFLD